MVSRPTGRRPGHPAKPVERKRRLGNPGGKKLPPPLAPVSPGIEPPEPSRPLGGLGLAVWQRAWTSTSWLHPLDIELVMMLCEQVDERAALRFRVLSEPENWRQRSQLRAIEAQVLAALTALGFTPDSRHRVAPLSLGVIDELALIRARRNNPNQEGHPS